MQLLARTKSSLEIASALALIVAAAVFVWSQFRPPSEIRSAAPVQNMVDGQIAAASLANVHGSATVALIEFGDFECPFCAQYAGTIHDRVRKELIDTGLVQFTFLHFPLERIHRRAFKASEAVECAGRQGMFWDMHDRLFANAKALDVEDIMGHAEGLGLDREHFELCLDGEAAEKVAADLAEGRRLGVNGTPAFFLGTVADDGTVYLRKRINGVVPFDVIKREVEAIRAASAPHVETVATGGPDVSARLPLVSE
jgi:protein-disulfide isomerase